MVFILSNFFSFVNSLIFFYKADIKPRVSGKQTMAFCFPLNRASYYLSNLEKDLQNKDLETLESMYALREKINRLTLEHRFIFEQNRAPILNIKIDRCKIIVEDKYKTMIFLDREETKKFIATIREMLDSKASVLSNKYPMDKPFSKDELRKLAESLDIDSAQDLLDKADEDVQRLSKECSQQFINAGISATKAVAKFSTKTVENLASPVVKFIPKTENGDDKDELEFTKEDVEKYVEGQRQINDDKTIQKTKASNNDLSSNSGEKSSSALAKAVEKLHLTPFQKSSLIEAFEKYLDYCVMTGELKLKQDKRAFMKKLKENEEDYVNLLKLYIRLYRGNYENRNNFSGILLTENRQHETNTGRGLVTQEYFIKEIQKLENIKNIKKTKRLDDKL